ncbi:MAG TPA: hypothetical protein VJM12_11760 [Pyrinomonadaceae bacterium]|nr:hypothetical protein [Pyrinomonadaceae bacterium]
MAAIILAIIACALAGVSWWESRRAAPREAAPDSNGSPPPDWLTGSTEQRFLKVERQLRGLDQAMAEIGYRYGELLRASRDRNWDYARYQTEKIDLSLKLALERRPKRAPSSQPFLNEDLPAVLHAIRSQDGQQLDGALERLHNSCIACHRAENVLYFRDSVERIRANATK